MLSILLLGWSQSGLPLQRLPLQLAVGSSVGLFPHSDHSSGNLQVQGRLGHGHPLCSSMTCSFGSAFHTTSSPSRPAHSGPQLYSPSCSQFPLPYSMAAIWLNGEEEQCSAAVHQILLNSRKSFTKTAYLAKWKRFSLWSLAHRSQLTGASI